MTDVAGNFPFMANGLLTYAELSIMCFIIIVG
jgi:hypothetical protein